MVVVIIRLMGMLDFTVVVAMELVDRIIFATQFTEKPMNETSMESFY